ncbi:MAG: DEAD/DEAH box helicase [Chloroflexi bacterium]|nr:DEAD/DEAH box helicase [Chloroflexota bacterium]
MTSVDNTPSPLEQALATLHPKGQIEAWHSLPAQKGTWTDWPAGLDDRLIRAANQLGISRPYLHQAQALDTVLQEQGFILVTPTASGKSLAFTLPTLQTLAHLPAARALWLFPTKALAQDQMAAVRRWEATSKIPIHPATYDGDTPSHQRPAIRRTARLIATNPDMLHMALLPHHTTWAEFFAGLRIVVLDEIHAYRGVLGSHVANVLRRLKRICRFYGSNPLFLCTSATIANPVEHAQALTGVALRLIDQDSAPRGAREFLFYNPPVLDPELGIRRSMMLEAAEMARHTLEYNLQTLTFARSRLSAELILSYIRQSGQGEVSAYRAGYLPSVRRAIELGLREGSVRGVVATNALELGVDVGELEVCILAGYPGSIASTWQQVGRAGRRANRSAAILIASASPLDQYLVRHPEYFFQRSPETARINPDNLLILLDHLRCAAFELPFDDGEAFSPAESLPNTGEVDELAFQCPAEATRELLEYLTDAAEVHLSQGRWYWIGSSYPAEHVSLRSAGGLTVTIQDQDSSEVIGTLDKASAPALVHPGAIYLHNGQTYLVEELDLEGGRAQVRPANPGYFTDAGSSGSVELIGIHAHRTSGGAEVSHGEVQIISRITSFKKIRWHTHENLGVERLDLPPQMLTTAAYWFCLAEATVDKLRDAGWWRYDPLTNRGSNWPQARQATRARDGFRCRHCNAPERPDRQHDVHHIQPFRTFNWIPGQNNNYLQANRLENLVTLCRECHWRAESAEGIHGALSGLGYAVGHLAPLILMCDQHDVGVMAEAQAQFTKAPTVTIYEQIPGGIGFALLLYQQHETLLRMVRDLVHACPCTAGCPGCIGPVTPGDHNEKSYVLALLDVLQ